MKKIVAICVPALAVLVGGLTVVLAPPRARAETPVQATEAAVTAVLADPKIIKALDDIKADDARAVGAETHYRNSRTSL